MIGAILQKNKYCPKLINKNSVSVTQPVNIKFLVFNVPPFSFHFYPREFTRSNVPAPLVRSPLGQEVVVAEAHRGRQNPEHEERLARRLVLDVVGHRVRDQERRLEEHLGQQQPKDDRRVRRLADGLEVGGDPELGQGDGRGAYVRGVFDAEGDGEGVEAHLAIALDGLEVVDDGDPESGDGVEDGTARGKGDRTAAFVGVSE